MRRTTCWATVGVLIALFCAAGSARGQSAVGHWRMEADVDAGPGLSVPNEVAGGSNLIGASASLAAPVPGAAIFNPLTASSAPNTLAANGDTDVNITAASYTALNVASLTAEGFFRTQENTATLMARNSGTTGFVISQPSNVTVTYYVNGISQTLTGGSGGLGGGAIDLDTAYTHIAFTYNAQTGVGNLYANGVLRGTNTTAGGGALFSAANSIPVNVGGGTFTGPNTGGYDGGGLSSGAGVNVGIIDEIRLTDAALTPTQFLQAVPEPTSAGTLLLLVASASLCRRNPLPRRR